MKQQLTGAQALLKRLEQHGITTIFGIPGGNILPIYDAMEHSNIHHILAKHEQGAGFMAQGMARSTGKPAVCMATSGPGATNLITAISDAWSDSVPMIAITGQVPQNLCNTDAFQEVDVLSMVSKITKKSYYITSAEDITSIIDEAFRIASEGRPGPVLIDIPKDVQLDSCEWSVNPIAQIRKADEFSSSKIEQISAIIENSQRPIIVSGHGSILAGVSDEIRWLAENQQIPVVTTLHGIGILPTNHELNIGMAGMHGFKTANALLAKSDLILAFGIRFDDRLTGKVNEFCPDATVIHIDINARELNRLKAAQHTLNAHLKPTLKTIIKTLSGKLRPIWIKEIREIEHQRGANHIDDISTPEGFIHSISQMANNDAIVTTDVGQHQMWVAQSYQFHSPRHFLTSGGQGTMGFGLPAAIGAAVANPDKQIICFTGDGSILMNIQELATIAELNLNIKIIIMNNAALGMVRQQQQLFYKQNYSASRYANGFDFTAIAHAFKINAMQVQLDSFDSSSIYNWLATPGASVLDVCIDETEMVTPTMQPGRSVESMLDCKKEELIIN